jgi:hypothetical protein
MTIYLPPVQTRIPTMTDGDKFTNTRIIYGNDQSLLVEDGIFFLEFIQAADSTTVTLKDGYGTTVVPGLNLFSSDHSPMRFDRGIQITGDVVIAKGFVILGILPKI